MAPALAQCVTASGDRFNKRGRRPWASVNFITAHDGFTLADTTSYNEKHNDANNEGNRDGHSDNRSWNCGVEGPTDDPEVLALRARQQRNMLATLLLSQGTPMLLAGDEFARTQQGNNNAYCQDSDISWFDWEAASAPAGRSLTVFTQHLTHLRHTLPVLRRNRFLTGQFSEAAQVKDSTWLAPDGNEMDEAHWTDPQTRCFGLLLEGTAPASSLPQPAADDSVLLVFNAWEGAIDFVLPPRAEGKSWKRVIDTALDPQEDADSPAWSRLHRDRPVVAHVHLPALTRPTARAPMTVLCANCHTANRDRAMFCIGCAGKLPAFAATGPSALDTVGAPLGSTARSSAGTRTEAGSARAGTTTGAAPRGLMLAVLLLGATVLVLAAWISFGPERAAAPGRRRRGGAAPAAAPHAGCRACRRRRVRHHCRACRLRSGADRASTVGLRTLARRVGGADHAAACVGAHHGIRTAGRKDAGHDDARHARRRPPSPERMPATRVPAASTCSSCWPHAARPSTAAKPRTRAIRAATWCASSAVATRRGATSPAATDAAPGAVPSGAAHFLHPLLVGRAAAALEVHLDIGRTVADLRYRFLQLVLGHGRVSSTIRPSRRRTPGRCGRVRCPAGHGVGRCRSWCVLPCGALVRWEELSDASHGPL